MGKVKLDPAAEGSGLSVKDMNSKAFEAWRKAASRWPMVTDEDIKGHYKSPTPKPTRTPTPKPTPTPRKGVK